MQGLDKPFSIELQLRKNHSQSASRLISRHRCKQCFHTVCLIYATRGKGKGGRPGVSEVTELNPAAALG